MVNQCVLCFRMLIQYGLMRGLIRHLQRYPVLVKSDDPLTPELDHLEEQW